MHADLFIFVSLNLSMFSFKISHLTLIQSENISLYFLSAVIYTVFSYFLEHVGIGKARMYFSSPNIWLIVSVFLMLTSASLPGLQGH